MKPAYPVVNQVVDMAAPGANTDILAEDFELPHVGVQDVTISISLQNAGKVKLVMKPGSTLTGAKATGQIQAIASSLLADGDFFTLKDGVHTKAFEFERVRKATGSIDVSAITAAALLAAETFTLDDGVNDPVVFEFVEDAEDIADPANIPIVFTGTETAIQLAALIADAIDGAADLDIAVTDNLDGTIDLENELAGTVGNVAIVEDVVVAGFVVTGMAGGLGTVGVTGGRVAVTVDPAATAAEVAEAIAEAVNGVGSGLTITATVNEDDDDKVDLENDDFGSVGNIANTENVTNAGFTVSGMTGGYGGDVTLVTDINGTNDLAADALYQKTFQLESGYLYNLQLTVDGIVRSLAVSSKQ